MQIKNKVIFIFFCFLNIFFINLNLYAEEFNISATEIIIDKENDTIIGKGSVEAIDSQGRTIKGNKITYRKSEEFL